MFEGRQVVLGPRIGDRFPVLDGLAPGDKVAAAGAFLIDAESRLNPTAVTAARESGPEANPTSPAQNSLHRCPEPGRHTAIKRETEAGHDRVDHRVVDPQPLSRHPRVVALGIAGVRAMMTMPVDAIPDLSENQVIVFTDWMGRSPQEIEDQITYPLSVNLQGLAGVKVVRSSSEFNFSMITIIFDEATDYYFARTARAGAAVDRLDVPAAGRDALPGPRRHGGRPDLLVHRRGRRQGPERAAVDPGLVRPLPAQQRAGSGGGRLGRRRSRGVPDRPRPQQAPRLRHQPGRGLLRRRPVELGRRRPGRSTRGTPST